MHTGAYDHRDGVIMLALAEQFSSRWGGGVSKELSPRAIVVGATLDYHKHCHLEFSEYIQTHEEHDNSMHSRTTGAIALRPTGNVQGGYYFMSLMTS